MSIRSSTFGRLTLTGPDAKRFRDQATYGRPKAAALRSVENGVALARKLSTKGEATVKLSREAKRGKR